MALSIDDIKQTILPAVLKWVNCFVHKLVQINDISISLERCHVSTDKETLKTQCILHSVTFNRQ